MFKKVLLLVFILGLSGCVERGFKLTVNQTTHTVSAVKSIDIRQHKQNNMQKDMDKMTHAVTKKQNEQRGKIPVHHTVGKISQPTHKNEQYKQEEDKYLITNPSKKQEHQKPLAEKSAQIEKDKIKLAIKQEADKEAITKQLHEKEALERKITEQKQKEMQKLAEQQKIKAQKKALEQKIAQDKLIQKQKEMQKLAEQQKIEAQKKALEQKIAQDKLIQKQKEMQKLAEQQKIEAQKKALETQQANKVKTQNTESLTFQASTKTYQKFGTSEIHGHVVYLTPSGQEIGLENTKIYLVPQNSTTNYWYNNYYLKNKTSTSLSGRTIHYINATHLNLERNFAFYGLSTGTYYIIIESSYPSSISKNKKVYIAKKINVEKYKKIMTVFSKRL